MNTRQIKRQVDGILLLDKPAGMTSNGVLQYVKRLFCAKKAGHTGSLDPIATGMLPICFGEATKFSQFLLESDKTYQVTGKLGVQTTTGDIEGEIVAALPVVDVTQERLNQVMAAFIGQLDQIPPMFSALKHKGRPLYEFARKGIDIERKPRSITVFSLNLLSFERDEFTFDVHCSKGTYVRTLVEDIGNALGCGAHVTALRRLVVSPYQHQVMYTLPELDAMLEKDGLSGLDACLLPLESSVNIFPAVKLSTAAAFYLRTGQAVRTNISFDSPLVRLMSEDARFLGVGEVMTDGRVKPHRLVSGLY